MSESAAAAVPDDPTTILYGDVVNGINTCSICYDEICNCLVSTCGHMYCRSCVDRLFDGGTTKCPQCRSPMSRSSIKSIYVQNIGDVKGMKEIVQKYVKIVNKGKQKLAEVLQKYGQFQTLDEINAEITRLQAVHGTYADFESRAARLKEIDEDHEMQVSIFNSHIDALKQELNVCSNLKKLRKLVENEKKKLQEVQHVARQVEVDAKYKARVIVENAQEKAEQMSEDWDAKYAEIRKKYWQYDTLEEINNAGAELRAKIDQLKMDNGPILSLVEVSDARRKIQKEINDLRKRYKPYYSLHDAIHEEAKVMDKIKEAREKHANLLRYTDIKYEIKLAEDRLKNVKAELADAERERNSTVNVKLAAVKEMNAAISRTDQLKRKQAEITKWLAAPEKIYHEMELLKSTIKFQREWIEKILKKGKVDLDTFKDKAEKAVETLLMAVTEPTH